MSDGTYLLFVYNANSSLFNQVGDLIHKTISPKAYQCNLCNLTYLGVSMKNDWEHFINTLKVKSEFLHKDEFKKKFPQLTATQFPAVFVSKNGQLNSFISTDEINQQKTLDQLKQLIQQKIAKLS